MAVEMRRIGDVDSRFPSFCSHMTSALLTKKERMRRALLRQPEIVVGTWRAARADAAELTETETRAALERLDPLWDELFPAEQARIVRSLVERVDVSLDGADVQLRTDGLASLVRDLHGSGAESRTAA